MRRDCVFQQFCNVSQAALQEDKNRCLGHRFCFIHSNDPFKGVEALLKVVLPFDFQVGSGNGAWGLIFR